jgi:hypothetical protein
MGSIAGGHEPGGGSLDLRCSSRPLLLIIPRDRSNSSAVDARGQRREREGSPPPSRARCPRRRRPVAATRHGKWTEIAGRTWRTSAQVMRRGSTRPFLGSRTQRPADYQNPNTKPRPHDRESNTLIYL